MFPIFSQEAAVPTGGANREPSSADGASVSTDASTLYVITAYEFSVKGRSRPSALIYKLIEHGEFREGEIITGKANFEKYISDIAQIYTNQRVLKDNVEVSYSTGAQNEDGAFPVTILIKVEDTWNIIALPRPYYKNDVFDLTIKARDYNFLGTMNPLRVDIGYSYNEDKQQSFLLGVYSDTRFKAFGYYWNFTFDNTVQFRIDAPIFYQNITGLSVELPFRSTTFTFGFTEKLSLNEENSYWDRRWVYNKNPDWWEENPDWVKKLQYQDDLYMSSNPYISWKIPTGLMVSRFGELTYTPVISSTFNHELPQWPLNVFHKGPFLNFSHTLGFDKIDWHANYREGLSVYMDNSYQYDFNNMLNQISFNFTGIGHYIVSDFFAVSTRLMYRYYWHFPAVFREGEDTIYFMLAESASSYMRGIADKSIPAYQMFILNLDFPFRLFVFTPSQWLNNKKFRFFDFEMHFSPVIDLAMYYERDFDKKSSKQEIFDKDKILYYPGQTAASGGVELVVFPLFMRNLYIRVGFAVNLKEFLTARPIKLPNGDNREIYLIMGHFY